MKLQIDTELTNFITQNAQQSIICALLSDMMYSDSNYDYKVSNGLIATDINWIRRSVDNPDTMISYLPTNKFNIDIDPFEDGIGRMQVRTGKFINKIFTKKCFDEYGIKDSDIEKFVNLFKSESTKYEGTYFEVVEGSSINKYYNCDNYYRRGEETRGTIWQSCMRKTEMYEFFNIYADNCKMLVLFTKDKLVLGRALLWKVMTPNKSTHYNFMDRIYYYEDSDVELFKKWALDNSYITKAYQDHHNYPSFMIDGKIQNIDLQVKLVKSEYAYYPYMDTFKFLCRKLKYLRNFDRLGKTWTLTHIDGNCEEIPEDSEECLEESEESYNYDDE